MAACNSVDHGFHETPDMYPNLKAVPLSNQQQFRLNKIDEIKDILLLRLKKEN